MMMDSAVVQEPFPIFRASKRYLLYDVDAITYIRREHHICGVLVGSLPQVPQQNVFLGLPLELMPEEAKLLVSKGAAFIVDDASLHKGRLPALNGAERRAFARKLHAEGKEAARIAHQRAEQRQEEALRRLGTDGKLAQAAAPRVCGIVNDTEPEEYEESKSFFPGLSSSAPAEPELSIEDTVAFGITPTTSYPPFSPPTDSTQEAPPQVLEAPDSYPLYAYLHSKDYYLSPGLRFGCQYLVYPGDPLRFHSHFLAVGTRWDEEFDLLDLVGGGRLGTGVKKGFLIGGVEGGNILKENEEHVNTADGMVRTFCVEWGGM